MSESGKKETSAFPKENSEYDEGSNTRRVQRYCSITCKCRKYDLTRDAGSSTQDDFGNCEGPNPMYVKLVSSDGHVFVLKHKYAVISGTIRAMLSGPEQCAVDKTNEINLKNIPSHVLQLICLYLAYKYRYANSPVQPPDFTIPRDVAYDLMMASNFLEC